MGVGIGGIFWRGRTRPAMPQELADALSKLDAPPVGAPLWYYCWWHLGWRDPVAEARALEELPRLKERALR